MSVTAVEMIDRISKENEVYLMVCGEAVVFDRSAALVYVPASNFSSASMNPMADFRTILGHGLLWSRQENLNCSSGDMLSALENAGFQAVEPQPCQHGWVARIARS